MSGRNNNTPSSSSDQPMDLAQKSTSVASRLSESMKAGATTFVQLGNGQLIGTNSSNVTCKSVATAVTVPSAYHIPRGAAVVANISASRSPSLTSIVRTSSHNVSPSSSSITATPRSNMTSGARFPVGTGNWISRGAVSPALVGVKTPQGNPGRGATLNAVRPTAATMIPVTKPAAIIAGSIRAPNTSSVRIGAEGIRQGPKGTAVHITHAPQKYIGSATVRAPISVGGNSLFSPTATLVTSLASSGTTITAHPGNRNQNPLRITTAITSSNAFSQSSQPNPSVGTISLTPTTSGTTILTHPPNRNPSMEHHIPIKAPFGTSISRIGPPAISMTKVIPKASSISVSSEVQPPHTNVIIQRTSGNQSTTVPQYGTMTPYFVESQGSGTFPIHHPLVSNHYAPTTGGRNTLTTLVTASETHQAIPIIKPNSSPRPSILRKRADNDGTPTKAAKNLSAALNLPLNSPPSPKRPDSRGNGNASSGSTTISANSSPGTMQIIEDEPMSLKKCDSFDESAVALSLMHRQNSEASRSDSSSSREGPKPLIYSLPQSMDGVSPRKKPRKQQLTGNELQEALPCEEEMEYPPMKKVKKELNFPVMHHLKATAPQPPIESEEEEEEDELDDEETDDSEEKEVPMETESEEASPKSDDSSTSPQQPMRPHMSLIKSYKHPWKARHNHFNNHVDVKPKDDKKKNFNDFGNQKLTVQRANGWKVVHISGQVEDMMDLESEVAGKLKSLLGSIEKRQNQQKKGYKDFEKDSKLLAELVRKNIQRSIAIKDQMCDAKGQMNKIFDHKENVLELLTKYSSRRTLRKKEKF